MGQFLGHGLTWALSTLLFLGIGWWLDGRIGTTPILTILGSFVGATAGFYSLYHHLVTAQKVDAPGSQDGNGSTEEDVAEDRKGKRDVNGEGGAK